MRQKSNKPLLLFLLTSSTFELRFSTAASENYSLMFLYKNFLASNEKRKNEKREKKISMRRKINETNRNVTEKREKRKRKTALHVVDSYDTEKATVSSENLHQAFLDVQLSIFVQCFKIL
jgi:hypothetical protein